MKIKYFCSLGNPALVSTIALAIALFVCVTILTAMSTVLIKMKVKAKSQAALDNDVPRFIENQGKGYRYLQLSRETTENVAYATVKSVY